MVTDVEMAELIKAVQEVSRRIILPRFRNLDAADIASKSAADDLVTIADREAEVALSEAASRILPGAAIVGEEAVSADPSHLDKIAGAERCVIIDPIDGTANFVAGLATFGVILAVVEQGRTVFGLLYDPVVEDWVAARAGEGAWFGRDGAENRTLTCRTVPAEAATGFVGPRLYPVASRGALFDAYQGFGLVRGLGCSCHDYRTIAFGKADFVSSPMMNPWDHAAGVLVVQEAGGAARVAGHEAYAPHMTKGPIAVSGTPDLLPAIEAAEAAGPRSRLE